MMIRRSAYLFSLLSLVCIFSIATWAQNNQNSVAYNNGYNSGVQAGHRDAGGNYTLNAQPDYQNATRGFNPSLGMPMDQYQSDFRNGFQAGYNAGYNGQAGGIAGAISGAIGAIEGQGKYNPPPQNQGYYGNNRGSYGRGYGYNSPGFNEGYREGRHAGQRDSNNGNAFDPRGTWAFRHPLQDYTGDMNSSPDQYRDDFQQGFLQGYNDGFSGR